MRYFLGFGNLLLALSACCLVVFPAHGQPVSNATDAVDLRLQDYLHQVLQHNETIQAQMLDAEVNRRKERGELGVFEPQLEASITREANRRTNNVLQAAADSEQALFDERNNIYDGGIEQLIPTGGKIRLGATMSDLGNNVNPYGNLITTTNRLWTREYQTFIGATFTQPLLKGAGFTPTFANIRLAALDSDIAFQEYRRQLMLSIYQAEGAYWNLYFAQEQVRFFDDSVSVAQKVLDDSREKLKAGQGADLDVMEAQSALALRNTKRNDAVQNYYDALGHLQALTGTSPDPNRPASGSPAFRAVDDPHTTNSPPAYADSFEEAFSLNPDYLIQQQKMNQERVRYGVAKNQLLPELNLKAAYGFNGIGLTPGDAWDMADMENSPSWSLGLELTVPLGGNIKGRNYYKAAQLSLQEAQLNLKGMQTQIANGLSTAIQKARAWQQSIGSYETVVNYNGELLDTQLARLKAGAVEAQKVLDVEANLLDSRQDLAGALGQYRRALLEVELNDGSILENRGLDLTRDELRRRTEALLGRDDNFSSQAISTPPGKDFSSPPPDKYFSPWLPSDRLTPP
jgi:outer membrane protein TolC